MRHLAHNRPSGSRRSFELAALPSLSPFFPHGAATTATMASAGVSAILHRSSLLNPTSPLFTAPDQSQISYGDAWRAVRRHRSWIERNIARQIASATQDVSRPPHRGIGRREKEPFVDVIVAYLSASSADYILSVLACTDASLSNNNSVRIRPALLNFRWTAEEIARALRVQQGQDGGSTKATGGDSIVLHYTIILYGPGFKGAGKDASSIINKDSEQRRRGHEAVALQMPNLVQNVTADGNIGEYELQGTEIDPQKTGKSDAVILFTSGTSSSSGAKGVRLSHRALLIQAMAKLCPPCSYDSRTNIVGSTVPFFHVGGLSSALAAMLAGGTLTFPPSPSSNTGLARSSFQPDLILRTLDNTNSTAVNTLVVVPAMIHSILQEGEKYGKGKQYPNTRLILVGGQSLTASQLERTRIAFPNARIVQTYACTEAGSSITFAQLHPSTGANSFDGGGSNSLAAPKGDYVGFATAHVEIQIYRQNDEGAPEPIIPASPNEAGIIATRGAHVMNGYWCRGEENIHARVGLTSDGWLMTNDFGYCDTDGKLYFSGRATDVIRSGGETIQATEVERVIAKHPKVEACALFGLPDEKYGEAVCVAIVLKGGRHISAPLTLIEIKQHCSERNLSSYKCPKQVFAISEMPTNSCGKVLKHKLVEMFSQPRSKL